MISLKRLIVEGRYDSLVTTLSGKLLGVIKDSYSATQTEDGKFAGKKIYYTKNEEAPHIEGADDDGIDLQPEIYFEEVEAPNVELEFYLILKVQWIEGFNDYRYGGDAYNETNRLAHNAADPPLIEKTGKYLRGDQARRDKIQSGELPTYNYWLLPKEQTAMIQGLYFQAKKERIPFSDKVNTYLNMWVDNGTITTEQREEILAAWRKQLPKLGIRQEL
jgi:hypothetical protein